MLFAYFNESMGSIGGHAPWISYNTNINWNKFTTVPKSGYLLCFTNGSHKFSVEFCVVKFSSFA